MPVTDLHPKYREYEPLWAKQRCVIAGEEAVKAQGVEFLPMLSAQSAEEYEAYKTRAMFYAAAGRTVQGLLGAITRKLPVINVPDEKVLETIGIEGENFDTIVRRTISEDISVGRLGLLVDAAETPDAMPYLAIYTAESITNWTEAVINGRRQPTLVVLRETVRSRQLADMFDNATETQYRVLRLTQETPRSPRVYQQDIYIEEKILRQGTDGSQVYERNYVFWKTVVPKARNGRAMDYIPFVCINTSSTELCPEKGPLLDLVNVNLSHYRTSADLEHGRHYTALPTAWVAGFELNTRAAIGASVAWVSTDPNAKAGYLEFTGAGLSHLQKGLESKEKLMAVLGARLLEERPNDPEAAEAMKMRQAGEYSALSTLSKVCSEGLTYALQYYFQWLGNSGANQVRVELNRDFNVAGLLPATLQAMMAAVQSGLMSWNTWFHNLQRAEIIPDSITAEQEAALIEEGVPLGDIPPPEDQLGQPGRKVRTPEVNNRRPQENKT